MNSKHDQICTLEEPPIFLDISPNASFCQRLSCRLRHMTLPCEWHHGTALFIRSRKNLLLERRRQLASGHWTLWHPYSPLKYYWDCLVATLMFAAFIYMPFQVFVVCPPPSDPLVLFCDAVAFVDIAVTFLTGYTEDESKQVVIEPKQIARKYLRGRFAYDLVAAMPLQLIEIHENCNYPSNTAMYLFKLPRLLSMQCKWTSVHMQLELSYVTRVMISTLVRLALFFHWMTYIHYQVPALCTHYYNAERNWMDRFSGIRLHYDTAFEKYTANLYLAFSLCIGAGHYSSIGGYIIPGLLLTSFMGIIGLIFLIYSFTTLLRLIMYMQYESLQYNGRLKELEQYMALKRLPKSLRMKIHLYIGYEFNRGYFSESSIMNTINEQIKQDINMHSCKKLVANVPMFNDMPVSLVNTIIFGLTRVLFMPGETTVRSGEPLTCMHLLCSGTVAVLNSAGKEIAHLRDGAFYGEDALLEPEVARRITIVALEITEIYKLSSEKFQACLLPYPQVRRRLAASRQLGAQ